MSGRVAAASERTGWDRQGTREANSTNQISKPLLFEAGLEAEDVGARSERSVPPWMGGGGA